jgi:glycosyltransferase involved in cell wall biosynthesis
VQLENQPELSNAVEVVISDNCSTDDTKDVSEGYLPRFKNLKYICNESNIGFDLNIYNVVKNASGQYCWYLGDDDVIVNGGIKMLLSHIKDNSYDFVGVTAEHLPDSDLHKDRQLSGITQIEIIDDFNDFYFKDYCQGGVSVLVFNRALWMSVVNIDDYLQHWLYYETVLRILVATKKRLAFIKNTLILTGQDCRWAENGGELFTFGNSNLLLERMILFGFDKRRVTDVLIKNIKKTPLILLRAKGHGLKCDLNNLKYIYKNLKKAGLTRLFLTTLIYFIPNVLIRFIRDLKKKIFTQGLSRDATTSI